VIIISCLPAHTRMQEPTAETWELI